MQWVDRLFECNASLLLNWGRDAEWRWTTTPPHAIRGVNYPKTVSLSFSSAMETITEPKRCLMNLLMTNHKTCLIVYVHHMRATKKNLQLSIATIEFNSFSLLFLFLWLGYFGSHNDLHSHFPLPLLFIYSCYSKKKKVSNSESNWEREEHGQIIQN